MKKRILCSVLCCFCLVFVFLACTPNWAVQIARETNILWTSSEPVISFSVPKYCAPIGIGELTNGDISIPINVLLCEDDNSFIVYKVNNSGDYIHDYKNDANTKYEEILSGKFFKNKKGMIFEVRQDQIYKNSYKRITFKSSKLDENTLNPYEFYNAKWETDQANLMQYAEKDYFAFLMLDILGSSGNGKISIFKKDNEITSVKNKEIMFDKEIFFEWNKNNNDEKYSIIPKGEKKEFIISNCKYEKVDNDAKYILLMFKITFNNVATQTNKDQYELDQINNDQEQLDYNCVTLIRNNGCCKYFK